MNLLESLYNCDLIIFLIDIKNYNLKDTLNILSNLYILKKEIVVVFNKNDLVQKRQILPKINELSEKTKISTYFSISAKKKLGLENLIKYLQSKHIIQIGYMKIMKFQTRMKFLLQMK